MGSEFVIVFLISSYGWRRRPLKQAHMKCLLSIQEVCFRHYLLQRDRAGFDSCDGSQLLRLTARPGATFQKTRRILRNRSYAFYDKQL